MNISYKQYYWRWIKNQFFLFCAMLALMTIARLAFSFYFGEWVELKTYFSLFRSALFLGMRFDLMPLAYVNFLPFIILNLAYFIPGKTIIKVVRVSVISLLFFGYLAIVWIYIFDYAFYSYFQEHLNILFFGFFEDDTLALLTSVWKNYNLPLWLSALLAGQYGLYRFIKLLFSPFEFDLKAKTFSWKMPIIFIVGLVCLPFFGRGNFTRLPLSLEDAHLSSQDFLNKLSLNGVLSLNRAIKIRMAYGLKDVSYLRKFGYDCWKSAFHHVFGKPPGSDDFLRSIRAKTAKNEELKQDPPHVVLVVMESFGTYWNSKHSSKFNILGSLKDHFNTGILFNNFLSAENGTIGSIVSVATSQVIRPGSRFLSESDFMKTPLDISGHLPYKNAGYETHFVYGGKLGWRDLGKYLTTQKYDYLWGADEIKENMPELNHIDSKDLGNEWGVFDEYLYTFIEEQLRTATKPQFFLVLTTSNHPPFDHPSSYNSLPLEISSEIQENLTVDNEIAHKRFMGLQYANQKMGEFLTRIKSTALTDKVVLALTGDHSYWIAKGVGLDEEFKRYAVPFYISPPTRLIPKNFNPHNFGSHEDIFPTLYHLTLSEAEYVKLGDDLINEEGMAMNSSGLFANKDGAYHHNSFWRWEVDKTLALREEKTENPKLKELKLKAESLIGLTDLYLKEEKKRKRPDAKNDQQ